MRKWDHHTGQWRLNALGRRWAAEKQSEYVVSIPCIFKVRRKTGESQEFRGYLPATNTIQGNKLEEMEFERRDVGKRGIYVFKKGRTYVFRFVDVFVQERAMNGHRY